MNSGLKKESWEFHWLTRWDEIWAEVFVQQWQSWLDQSPSAHVFFQPALVKAWVETYLPLRDIRPYFLIAESADHKVFFPLLLWQRNWKNAFQRLLIPVGYSDYDYHDPIIVGDATGKSPLLSSFWPAFVNELNRSGGLLRFDRIALDGIRQAFAGVEEGWTKGESCPWVDLRPFRNPQDFLPSLKTSLRGDLRRQERRINETGEMKYMIFKGGMEEEALQELTPFLAAHARRWPEAYKAPYLHVNLVRHGMKENVLYFSVLKIGEETAAWHLGFIFRDRYYYYLPAQEEKFDRLSPGKVLLLKCIEDAISKGFSIYDFLRGDEIYKTGWTDKAEQLYSLNIESARPFSKIRNLIVDHFKTHFVTL